MTSLDIFLFFSSRRKNARTWQAIWPEAFRWTYACIDILVRVDDKPDMTCPREKLVR